MKDFKVNNYLLTYIDVAPDFVYSAYKNHCYYGSVRIWKKHGKILLNCNPTFLRMVNLKSAKKIIDILIKKIF